MSTCLYCTNEAHSVEHPLPAAFGEFQDAPLLEDRVCTPCNNKRLGLLDQQLSRCGPESVFRRFFDVQGRPTHEKVNPHYRGSAGGHRLEMKSYDTEMGVEVELEILPGGEVRQSRQLVVVESSGKTHHLPIPPNLRDPEKLRAAYSELGVMQPADIRLIYDPEELVWLEPLFKAAFPSMSFGDTGPGARNYQGAIVKLQLTDRYFRAIAKIGFHYFLTQFLGFTGSEPCFSAIRDFIITDDGGGLDHINEFIGERQNPLLGPMMCGARPDGWAGHVVCSEIRDELLAHVQLFVCEQYRAPVYTVRLAANQNSTIVCATGHIYKYFEEGLRGKFSGEARVLGVSHAAVEPSPLKPAIREP
jgi:hypothetical protein